MEKDESLCETCTSFIEYGPQNLEEGRFWSGSSRSYGGGRYTWPDGLDPTCPFCQLIKTCLLSDPEITPRDFHETGKGERVDHLGYRLGAQADIDGYELCTLVHSREDRRTKVSKFLSIQLSDLAPDEVRKRLAEPGVTEFNTKELRGWLDACHRSHGKCKIDSGVGSGSPGRLPQSFRLIDTQRGCVVAAPDSAHYWALSYVWGGANRVLLTTATLPTLTQDGVLFRDELGLPRTISDAVSLCRSMGQQFLWVDSLCIVQDGKEDKQAQIQAMDAVYLNSALTIVSATGDDADAGLSPYGGNRMCPNGPPLTSLVISGKAFVPFFSPAKALGRLFESNWFARGWTLQEYVLSPRVAFFTGQYVFFQCREALWGEDFGLRLSTFRPSANGFNSPNWELPMERFFAGAAEASAREASQRPREAPKRPDISYSLLLGNYLRRKLTNDVDMLDAFLGVLNYGMSVFGEHYWGISVQDFGLSLLWVAKESHPRLRRPAFPSWSWAGWAHGDPRGLEDEPGEPHQTLKDDVYWTLGDQQGSFVSLLFPYAASGPGSEIATPLGPSDRPRPLREKFLERMGVDKDPWYDGHVAFENGIPDYDFAPHYDPPPDAAQVLREQIEVMKSAGLAGSLPQCVFFWASCTASWETFDGFDQLFNVITCCGVSSYGMELRGMLVGRRESDPPNVYHRVCSRRVTDWVRSFPSSWKEENSEQRLLAVI